MGYILVEIIRPAISGIIIKPIIIAVFFLIDFNFELAFI